MHFGAEQAYVHIYFSNGLKSVLTAFVITMKCDVYLDKNVCVLWVVLYCYYICGMTGCMFQISWCKCDQVKKESIWYLVIMINLSSSFFVILIVKSKFLNAITDLNVTCMNRYLVHNIITCIIIMLVAHQDIIIADNKT